MPPSLAKQRPDNERRRRAIPAATCCLSVVVVALLGAHSCLAFPSGAPESACKDMTPGHAVEPQTGAAPFELSQDKLQVVAGDQVKVTLSSPSKVTFKGLIVQATNEKGEPFGKFVMGKGLKLLDSCSAVTHSDRESKKTATLFWEAPSDLKEKQPVAFKATVVQKFDTIYMGIKSSLAATSSERRRRSVAAVLLPN